MSSKILFVDDEQNILDGIKRLLRGKYEIHTALGGEDGLKSIAAHGKFAVIVADMRMPQMNGLEFLERARQADPSAVLMMLTGNADRQTAVDAVDRGKVFHFLTKPCSEETLTQALDAGLKLYNLQGQIGQIESYLRKAG